MDFGGGNDGPNFDDLMQQSNSNNNDNSRMSVAVRQSKMIKRKTNDLTVPHLTNLHEDPL